jgi:hypothetical protein
VFPRRCLRLTREDLRLFPGEIISRRPASLFCNVEQSTRIAELEPARGPDGLGFVMTDDEDHWAPAR